MRKVSEGGSVTTVTLRGRRRQDVAGAAASFIPSKEALDAAGTGAADAMGETFEQLDELLVTLGASAGGS